MIRAVAEMAARAGSQVLLARFDAARTVRTKGFRDIVTDADVAAQDAILAVIRQYFPDHGVLSEEGLSVHRDSEWLWVIDPLDGTTNYAHHYPSFAVSVAVIERGEPVAGVVVEPLRDYVFAAKRGTGATLNNQPLHVSACAVMAHAVIGLDWAHAPAVRGRVIDSLAHIAPAAGTLRVGGSAALGLCYVAAGWQDAYFHFGLQPWDEAAAGLIVREAGGLVSNPAGADWTYTSPACLASNGLIHSEILGLLQWP